MGKHALILALTSLLFSIFFYQTKTFIQEENALRLFINDFNIRI